MIVEMALFPVKSGRVDSFQRAFGELAHLLVRAEGYRGHQLMQGVETPSHFHLIVQWQALADHQGFEASEDHDTLLRGLQAHLASEPVVHHVQSAASTNQASRWFA